MALYPDLQEKLYEGTLEHIGHKKAPKSDDIHKMPLFNAFLHEVLRYVSLVPQGAPHCPTEAVKLGGYDIPAGTQIYVNQYAIRKLTLLNLCIKVLVCQTCLSCSDRDPRYWKYPDTFNVKNFLDDNGKFVCQPQFMPFGWGKRMCLGSALARAEFFVFTLRILQEFRMTLPEKVSED